MNIPLSREFVRRIFFFQIFAAILLALLSLTVSYLRFVAGRDHLMGLFDQFYANHEANVPSWYSATVILFSASLLAAISLIRKQAGDRFYRYWAGLAIIFVFLSLDEIASLHNMADIPVRSALHTSGYFYFAWVIPYVIFAVAVGLGFLKLLRSLPRDIAFLMILSGAFYVAAAAGMEIIEGPLAQNEGFYTMKFAIVTTVEECLELVAMAVFNYALLRYILQLAYFQESSVTTDGPVAVFVPTRGGDARKLAAEAEA